jgi:hypothetical protein
MSLEALSTRVVEWVSLTNFMFVKCHSQSHMRVIYECSNVSKIMSEEEKAAIPPHYELGSGRV